MYKDILPVFKGRGQELKAHISIKVRTGMPRTSSAVRFKHLPPSIMLWHLYVATAKLGIFFESAKEIGRKQHPREIKKDSHRNGPFPQIEKITFFFGQTLAKCSLFLYLCTSSMVIPSSMDPTCHKERDWLAWKKANYSFVDGERQTVGCPSPSIRLPRAVQWSAPRPHPF